MSDQHAPHMSASKQNSPGTGSDQEYSMAHERFLDRFRPRSLIAGAQRVGFWSAVSLPFLHLPLLLSGIDTSVEVVVYLSLLAVNVLALLVGHAHYS
jgi:hypothetical protein